MNTRKYIPKKKFLAQQYMAIHSMSLKLNDDYPDIEQIKLDLQANEDALKAEEQKVSEFIKDFNTYFKHQNLVNNTIKFFLILHGLVTVGLFTWLNPITAFVYLGISTLITSGITLAMYPFLYNVLKMTFQGETCQSLIDYRTKLNVMKTEKYDKLKKGKNKISTTAEYIKREEQFLTPDLVESRNAAVWQVNAFRENAVYWRQIFTKTDYQNIRSEIKIISELLRTLRIASDDRKPIIAASIDEHLKLLSEFYEISNCHEETSTRTRKILK